MGEWIYIFGVFVFGYIVFCAGASWAREFSREQAVASRSEAERSISDMRSPCLRICKAIVDFADTEASSYYHLIPWLTYRPWWAWKEDLVFWLRKEVHVFGLPFTVRELIVVSAIATSMLIISVMGFVSVW